MNRIRQLRKEKGLSLRELAPLVYMSYSNLGFLERGDSTIKADAAKILADFFGVSVDYLLGYSDVRVPFDIKTFFFQKSDIKMKLIQEVNELTDEQASQVLGLLQMFKGGKN